MRRQNGGAAAPEAPEELVEEGEEGEGAGDSIIAPSPPPAAANAAAPFRGKPAAAKAVAARRFRVMDLPKGGDGQIRNVSVGKFQTRLMPGKELDEREYDIAKLRSQGVKLEEIAEATP